METLKQLKKIDIHAHATAHPDLFPPYSNGQRFVSAEELIEFYDRLGIEKGVLLPIISPEGQQTQFTTEDCKLIADRYPERFAWFCNVDPRASANNGAAPLSDILMFYKEKGAKGVGEITAQLWADDRKVDHLFACCAECELPVLIHISPDFSEGYGLVDEAGLYRLEKMLKKHPNLHLLGHSAPFWCEISSDYKGHRNGYPKGKVTEGRLAQMMRECPNLSCDLSAGSGHNAMMRDPEYAAGFMEEFADRIYYGCDVCTPNESHWFDFRDFLDQMLDDGMIRPETYRKIARGNAEKLLGLGINRKPDTSMVSGFRFIPDGNGAASGHFEGSSR